MADIIRYQITPKEIYEDGFDFDLDTEEPQCTYTNKDAGRQRTFVNADKYETLDTGISPWCNFEMNSDQSIYVSFWNGATMIDEFKATYINIISESNTRVIKIRNLSGSSAVVQWKHYG